MNKELKYGGYSASPNDHDAVDSDLAVCMNLIPEHGTIRPVLPPSVIAHIPGDPGMPPNDKGRKVLCIHKTSAYEHYIVAIKHQPVENRPHFWYLYQWDGTDSGTLDRLGMKAFYEIYKVEPVGNTLVALTDDGLHYYLWKQDKYIYLGDHLPELSIQFYMMRMNTFFDGNSMFETDERVHIDEETTLTELKTMSEFKNAAIAAANKCYAYNSQKRRFTFPFFVRYGLHMYDDSVTMMSAPALMALSTDVPNIEVAGITMAIRSETGGSVAYVSQNDNRDEYTALRCSSHGYMLCFRVVDETQVEELEKWKDIVTHVRFFVSPQFITYNQDSDLKNVDVEWDRVQGHPLTVELENNNQLDEQIAENPNFYYISELKPERLLTDKLEYRNGMDGYEPGFSKVPIDFDLTNDNIVARETATDDYNSHDKLIPATSFSYNSRLNLANMRRSLFGGFSPCCFWNKPHTGNVKSTKCVVAYEKEDGTEVFLDSETRDVVFDDNNTILWFFYPDERAKRAYFKIGNVYYEITLKPHNTLTGSYYLYLEDDTEQTQVDSIPTPSTPEQRLVAMPNKVYTSEVNNPFYFPVTGINSIDSGNIMGICAAVRPVSTGQMGYADLYIFADSGVWTAKINEKGTYSNVTLATGDVCINADSITQMETSVLFTTDRGIMLISGSQAQCISEIIDDDGSPAPGLQDITDELASFLDMQVEIGTFKDFMRECRMIYDYTGQRIIVYNRDYSYAYIYSLESNKWGMMQSNIDYSVRAYPESLAVDKDGNLVNCTVGDGTAVVSQLLITRPVTLDAPDVLKTVTTVLQRGLFRKGSRMRNDRINAALYGTRDLYNWDLVMTSRDENMRGRRGTPYKWFRIALMMRLPAGESVTGCSVQFDPRYTNRLR